MAKIKSIIVEIGSNSDVVIPLEEAKELCGELNAFFCLDDMSMLDKEDYNPWEVPNTTKFDYDI